MSPEQFAAILSALAAVLVAIGGLLFQVRVWHHQVNSRMDQLLTVTRRDALAQGKLEGPDEA